MKPQVENLTSLLSIQKGAVVSRTLINQKTGTITFFAFDTGEGLSEHKAPFDAFVQIIEGEMEITIAGEVFQLAENDTISMPANDPHALIAKKPSKMLLVMIRS